MNLPSSGLTTSKSPPAERYLNRELSWLDFNSRVLALAEEPDRPLLERVRFAAIVSTNLDEFFQIRVAGLKEQARAGVASTSIDGMSPAEQPDELRPLDEAGFRRADALVDLLDGFPMERVVSSPSVRCVQTVELLARTRRIEIEIDDRLAEGAPWEDTLALIRGSGDRPTLLCTHGDVIGHVLRHLRQEGGGGPRCVGLDEEGFHLGRGPRERPPGGGPLPATTGLIGGPRCLSG